jgi:circadian clock protein KaiC
MMHDESTQLERFPSHISGLDTILRGGFLQGGVYIVQGAPGAGKTILANEVCFRHVAHGGRAVYVTLLAESHSRMLQHHSQMSFFDESAIPESLYYISAFRILEDDGLKGLVDLLRREIKAQRSTLLILDGLVAAEESAPTDRDFKKFIHELQSHAAANGCTTLLLTSGNGNVVTPEHTMVDGLIQLDDHLFDVRVERSLTVKKFRGSAFLRGKHSFRITTDGIKLFPRVEAVFARPTVSDPGQGPKLPTGVAELDALLYGGLCGASVTGVVGPSGAGKTLFGLQFLSQSKPSEPGLYFGFFETQSRLVAKARAIGMNLQPLLDQGTLEILWYPQGENILDELAHVLIDAVTQRGVRRLVLDGLNGLLQSVTYPERISRYLACLMNELRARGVTTVMSMETEDIAGSEMRLPVIGVSALLENLLFLRFVELGPKLSRSISVTKMRNSAYDARVREYLIDADGIGIGEPLLGLEGFITGDARRPSAGAATPRSVTRRKATKK